MGRRDHQVRARREGALVVAPLLRLDLRARMRVLDGQAVERRLRFADRPPRDGRAAVARRASRFTRTARYRVSADTVFVVYLCVSASKVCAEVSKVLVSHKE